MILGKIDHTLTPEEIDTLFRIYRNMLGTARQGTRTDDQLLRHVFAMALELVFCNINDLLWVEEIGPDAWTEFPWDAIGKDGKTYDLKRQQPSWWAVEPEWLTSLYEHRHDIDYVVTGTMKFLGDGHYEFDFIRIIETEPLFSRQGLNEEYWFRSKFKGKESQFVFNHKAARDIIVEERA